MIELYIWILKFALRPFNYTVCPRNLDPFYIVTYCINWVILLGQTVPIVNRIYEPGSGGCSTIYGARFSRNLHRQDFEGRLYVRQEQGYIYATRGRGIIVMHNIPLSRGQHIVHLYERVLRHSWLSRGIYCAFIWMSNDTWMAVLGLYIVYLYEWVMKQGLLSLGYILCIYMNE